MLHAYQNKHESEEEVSCIPGLKLSDLPTNLEHIENKIIKVNIWDTAGQERFTSMITTYYKGAKGALLVYDITRRNTFNNIDNWLKELIAINSDKISIMLIGNKNDLSLLRRVSKSEAQYKANKYGIKFYETSALDSTNVKEAFHDLLKEMYIELSSKISMMEESLSWVVFDTFRLRKL